MGKVPACHNKVTVTDDNRNGVVERGELRCDSDKTRPLRELPERYGVTADQFIGKSVAEVTRYLEAATALYRPRSPQPLGPWRMADYADRLMQGEMAQQDLRAAAHSLGLETAAEATIARVRPLFSLLFQRASEMCERVPCDSHSAPDTNTLYGLGIAAGLPPEEIMAQISTVGRPFYRRELQTQAKHAEQEARRGKIHATTHHLQRYRQACDRAGISPDTELINQLTALATEADRVLHDPSQRRAYLTDIYHQVRRINGDAAHYTLRVRFDVGLEPDWKSRYIVEVHERGLGSREVLRFATIPTVRVIEEIVGIEGRPFSIPLRPIEPDWFLDDLLEPSIRLELVRLVRSVEIEGVTYE
ncbi:MAG: hypothetical protein HY696_11250 [Deltaproteobacteria bacterium]|nr:hypothetical protein [Deltaproteobacteria bacterium]